MLLTRLRTSVIGVLLASAAVVGSVAPAAAHDELVESSPGAGEVLASAPTEVRLTFSAELVDAGAVVAVTDDRDESWAVGQPQVVENVATAGISEALPDGEYVVLWRVVSSDGHPISGTFSFAVGSGESAAAPDSPVGAEPERGGESKTQESGGEPFPVGLVAVVSGSAIALVLGGSAFWYLRRRFRGVQ